MEGPSLPVRRIAFLIVLLLVAASLPLTFLINFQVGGTALALAAVVAAPLVRCCPTTSAWACWSAPGSRTW